MAGELDRPSGLGEAARLIIHGLEALGIEADRAAGRRSARLIPARDARGVFEAPGAVWADADVDQAAAWLRRLADDEGLRARLGAAAQRAAMERLGPGPLRDAVAALTA